MEEEKERGKRRERKKGEYIFMFGGMSALASIPLAAVIRKVRRKTAEIVVVGGWWGWGMGGGGVRLAGRTSPSWDEEDASGSSGGRMVMSILSGVYVCVYPCVRARVCACVCVCSN